MIRAIRSPNTFGFLETLKGGCPDNREIAISLKACLGRSKIIGDFEDSYFVLAKSKPRGRVVLPCLQSAQKCGDGGKTQTGPSR